MQRVTPLLGSPSCHQITNTLEQNPDKKKSRKRRWRGQERLQSHLQSVQWYLWCSVATVPEQHETFCCQRRERGGGRVPCERLVAVTEKNRYQIKKVCLKTVHMPAPGDFKYLWFTTFLIFKSSRDAARRIWCEHIPCLTWLWLVNSWSSGKGKAGSHKGFWSSPRCGPDGVFPYTLEAKSEMCPFLLTLALFLPLAIPSQATRTAPSKALLLQAER